MGTLVRKTWPKVRTVRIHGVKYYRVDARKTGTGGKQETFKSQKEALERATEIQEEFAKLGIEGLEMPSVLRTFAFQANELLKPYGKSVLEAAIFYKAHLDAEKKRQESAIVSTVAQKWYDEKKSGKTKKLRADTLRGILDAKEILEEQFGAKRILEVTTADIRNYLDFLDAGLRRKFNVCSLFSQFFNWAIAHGYTTENPTTPIKIEVEDADVHIFTPAQALTLMKKCEAEYNDLLLYHAISLFAGLRPTECQLLTWEHIHVADRTITVLKSTSKTKETRNVPISDTLMAWLEKYRPENTKGSILLNKNFAKRSQALRAELGYQCSGKNPEGPEWPQDVLRHSYGSYWLAKHKNRAQLAENMGNSVQIIKKHYKQVVSNAAVKEYWKIVPGYDGIGVVVYEPTLEDLEKIRVSRLAAAL